VLHSGRTIRAALNELFDFGRPRAVRLAVLASRAGRELPIAPDYLGAEIDVQPDEDLVLSNDNGKLRLAAVKRP
jgi:pyrimidine operon attenuation protein/uracil phosphoribosyltransferase